MRTPSTGEEVRSSPPLGGSSTPPCSLQSPGSWSPSTLLKSSALRTQLVVSTECSTGGEDTCSRRPRPPAPPCSLSRPTCLSTSPSGSQLTSGPTLEARSSPSACSITGRSFQDGTKPNQIVEECKKRKGLKPGPPSLDNYLDKM